MSKSIIINNQSDLKECQELLQKINYPFSIKHNLFWPNDKPIEISLDAPKKIKINQDQLLFSVDGVLLFQLGIGDSYYVDPGHGLFFTISHKSLLTKIEYSLLPIEDIPYVVLKDYSCHHVLKDYINNPRPIKKFNVNINSKYPALYERNKNNNNIFFSKKEKRQGDYLEVEYWG